LAEPDKQQPQKTRDGPRIPIATQVLLALAIGALTGLFLGQIVAPLKIVGDTFIRLLQITVLPYISIALITGLGRLDFNDVKRLAAKGGTILLLLWGIAITLVVMLPLAFPDWPSRSLFQKSSIETVPPPEFLQLYIPSNPFFSLANGIVPAIVVFSVMIGLALTGFEKKQILIEPLSLAGEVLSKITGYIARLAPYGVFALIAYTTGTMSFGDLARLQVYVVIMVTILSIIGLWLLPGLIAAVTPLHHGEILKRLRTPLVTAFATGSSLVVLPMLAEICKDLIAETRPEGPLGPDEEEQEEAESSVDVLIPTFFSFPTIGGVLSLTFVLFAGWYIGAPIATQAYAGVLSGGLASLFGGSAIAMPFTLGLAGLPRDLFQLFLSTDVIVSRFGTFVSVMHYGTIALIGTFAIDNLVRVRPVRLARVGTVALLLFGVALLGIRAFYTHVVVVPYTMDQHLRGLHNLRSPQPSTVYRLGSEPRRDVAPSGPRSLSEIRDSGVLRACYFGGNYPLAFFNSDDELVGFDIEMTHRFAARLDVDLEFIHIKSTQDLIDGYCDVFFNSLALNPDRAEFSAATAPFNQITVGFVVPHQRRDQFVTWNAIEALGEITVAASTFQSVPPEVSRRIPEAEVVRLSSYEEQRKFFESGGESAVAMIDSAEEGAAWTILYPLFAVVVPRPVIQLPIVYQVAPDNPVLLRAVDDWLALEQATGGIDEIYDYWVQGRTEQIDPPRWSVIRDVLGWVD
jgi:Na+/H+-dicarboxylate symporter/ABC-type amino acid transport substrate-binding protein